MEYRYMKEVIGNVYPHPYKNRTFLFMLADLLKEKGFSQRKIAEIIEINHVFIHKFANGKIEELPLGHALKLCVELGCTLDDLLPIVNIDKKSQEKE